MEKKGDGNYATGDNGFADIDFGVESLVDISSFVEAKYSDFLFPEYITNILSDGMTTRQR